MPRAFICIGSNIEPETNIARALRMLSRQVTVLALSNIYLSQPEGAVSQPAFYNAAVLVDTDLPPETLKWSVLRPIEEDLGRIRSADKYAARTIDLDIVLYGDVVKANDDLTLPDPAIPERAFVAVPLYELAPDLTMPDSGLPLREIVRKFEDHEMEMQKGYSERLRKELLNGF